MIDYSDIPSDVLEEMWEEKQARRRAINNAKHPNDPTREDFEDEYPEDEEE